MPTITPNLWFDTEALEAAGFYVSIFPNSNIGHILYYGEGGRRPAGTVMSFDFALDGQPYFANNGGPQFGFTEAFSLMVNCADQQQVDYYWEKLTEGGQEVQCGWLKDRYGVSWQVVPDGLIDLLDDPDEGRRERATAAMLNMIKIDLAAVQAAADGR